MRIHRVTTRAAAVTATLGIVSLAAAGTASAHVTANPGQATQGGYAKISFRVPDEQPNAGTIKLTVTFPTDHPLTSVRTKPMPGWTAQVDKVKLDKPVTVEGAQVTEAVRSVTWTADAGVRIAPEEFEEFDVSAGPLPEDTDKLVMPAEQTYDNGQVVRWDAPPQAPGAPEPEHPAPTVDLVAGGHGSHHHDSGHAGMTASGRHTDSDHASGADDTARLLGGAGLVVGALGLGVGAGALSRGRRSR
jgi:uncharacterized protein YcnI